MGYIELEGQKNTRDLGGIITLDQRKIRPHRLIRSGRISELTVEDISILLARYQLRTVVDFRAPKEIAERPDPRWGIVEHYELPVLSDASLSLDKPSGTGSTVLDALTGLTTQAGFSPKEYMKDAYRKFIDDGQAQRAYRRFFELLLAHKEGSLLFHCNGGKDRTGIATIFLLTALNVSWQVIYEDFMLTNTYLRPVLERSLAKLPERYQNEKSKNMVRELFLVDDSYLSEARSEMCKVAGTPLYYVQNVLGVEESAMEELRRIYLE